MDRRDFLRRAAAAASWGIAVPLFAACAPASAPSPTAAPAKPTEAAKSAAPAGQPAASPAAAAAPAVAGPVKKVSYGIVSYNPFHLAIIVATEKPELMRKHGVEVDLIITGTAPAAVQALVGGSMNMTTTSPDSGWPAQDKTPGMMQVIGIATGLPYSLMVNSEVKTVPDLKGKTVAAQAIRGGADTTALRLLLLENGLKDGDYDILTAGSVAERTAAMKAGTALATAQLEPQTTVLKDAGFVELDNADNYPALKNVQSVTAIAKKDWYEPNMDVAVSLVKGWIEITKWIYDPKNKDETIDLMAKTMKVEQRLAANAYERHVVRSKALPLEPRVDLKLMEAWAENHRRIGTPNVPEEQSKYVDNSIVEKALQG